MSNTNTTNKMPFGTDAMITLSANVTADRLACLSKLQNGQKDGSGMVFDDFLSSRMDSQEDSLESLA
jgi:hypothetical protein